MKEQPRDPEEGICVGKMSFNILSQGFYIGLITLVSFYIGLTYYSVDIARTMAFGTLSFSQLWQALNSRSARDSLIKIGLFTNKYLLMAIVLSGTLQLSVMLIPPLGRLFEVAPLLGIQWQIIIVISFTPIIFVEILKALGVTYNQDQ
jgi:Ca2+-transporting ATPase